MLFIVFLCKNDIFSNFRRKSKYISTIFNKDFTIDNLIFAIGICSQANFKYFLILLAFKIIFLHYKSLLSFQKRSNMHNFVVAIAYPFMYNSN